MKVEWILNIETQFARGKNISWLIKNIS
jgi:hypothetical protein